jgi:hypothetical protein
MLRDSPGNILPLGAPLLVALAVSSHTEKSWSDVEYERSRMRGGKAQPAGCEK